MSNWCTQHLIVTVDSPSGSRESPIAQPFARVGSDPRSEVVIEDASVAPRSLYLHATDEGVFCLYLDVDVDADGKGRWLAGETIIPLGAYRLQARLAGARTSEP